jgi:hypothetical protein
MLKRKSLPILAVFLSLIISFILGELLFRFVFYKGLERNDERNLVYRYDPELGWFPREADERYYQGSQKIFVKNNTIGFRDHEYGPKIKPRMAVIGDSFVWGYDVNSEDRFTEKLQERIPSWEVLNLGVSGYGTDQEYLLIKKYYGLLKPDVVILFICVNDKKDTSSNNRYHGYFKPYFTFENSALKVQGQPVPKSVPYYYLQYPIIFSSYLARAVVQFRQGLRYKSFEGAYLEIIKAMRSFVEGRGGKFFVVYWHNDQELKEFLEKEKIDNLWFMGAECFPSYGNHWTPNGHINVANRLIDFMTAKGVIQQN